VRVGHVLDHVGEQDVRPQLVFLVRAEPVQDRLPGPAHIVEIPSVHLEHAELPLDEQDARLDRGHRAQRQVGDPLDGQRGRHLDDERVLAGERRVAAGPGRGAQVRGELRPQVAHQEVDPQLGAVGRRGLGGVSHC
jgi:hypothetical protein